MSTNDNLSEEDKEFLAKCEEELKDRYTDNDVEFMKVYNAEPPTPPIMESWWVPQNQGRWNDRRNRRNHPYDRRRGQGSRYNDNNRRDNDYNRRDHGYHNNRPRY